MQSVIEAYNKHPKIKGTYSYGTAGFRMKSDLLDSIMFTVGCLAVLRSRFHGGKQIGIMVTASHNPEHDNGVKLVEPMGEMLEQSWEGYAIDAANCETGEELVQVLENIAKKEGIDMKGAANVVIARDTRPSGKDLVASSIQGVESMGGKVQDFGILTTPQLHYITRCLNTVDSNDPFGEPTQIGYHQKLSTAFKSIIDGKPRLPVIHIDAANGVGAVALEELALQLGPTFDFKASNTDIKSKGVLNHNCGADYVKINQSCPSGMTPVNLVQCCSLDGDADRIVFYFNDGYLN